MLVTWALLSLIKLFLFTLFIGMIICFLDGPLVVMLIWGLGLLLLLIIYWILLILLALRVGKASLILRMLSVLLLPLEACVYDIPHLSTDWARAFDLKYLETLLTSLGIFVGIREGSLSTLASLMISLPSGLLFLIGVVLGMQWYDTFCLNKLLWMSAISTSHLVL